jgi:hypothetical protein
MEKARISKSKMKAVMMVCFNIRGVIMIEWVRDSQTVNQRYCLEILTKLRERVRKKRPELWKNTSWILHEDSVSSHNILMVKQFCSTGKFVCSVVQIGGRIVHRRG